MPCNGMPGAELSIPGSLLAVVGAFEQCAFCADCTSIKSLTNKRQWLVVNFVHRACVILITLSAHVLCGWPGKLSRPLDHACSGVGA